MDADQATVGLPACGAEQVGRWAEAPDLLQSAVSGRRSVVVDGNDGLATWVADRLAERLLGAGYTCLRLTQSASRSEQGTGSDPPANDTVTLADGPGWRARPYDGGWEVVV